MTARNEISLQVDEIVSLLTHVRAEIEQAPSAARVETLDGPSAQVVADFRRDATGALQRLASRTAVLEQRVHMLVSNSSAAVRDLAGVDDAAAASADSLRDAVAAPTSPAPRTQAAPSQPRSAARGSAGVADA
ncbi:hypothetical protein [Demequina globuliformis]|uniref:hypothetical protein n=1 Tax=Demequina globuliformis TaxID=676202 RepID=UPI00078266C4|nr:hypothetical protein [Demequina globuliformis]